MQTKTHRVRYHISDGISRLGSLISQNLTKVTSFSYYVTVCDTESPMCMQVQALDPNDSHLNSLSLLHLSLPAQGLVLVAACVLTATCLPVYLSCADEACRSAPGRRHANICLGSTVSFMHMHSCMPCRCQIMFNKARASWGVR